MHPKVAQWAREHKDDVLRPNRQKLAFAADAMAQAKGYAPGTDEYLDFLDENMGYLEPEPKAKQSVKPARRSVAAPASRSSGSSSSTRIALNQDDLDMAKSLKMSAQEYAKCKAKANEGQLTAAQAGGRLHARYTA